MLVRGIPGLANTALLAAAERCIVHPESKCNVTVDVFDAVPRTVGVKEFPGLFGVNATKVKAGAVTS